MRARNQVVAKNVLEISPVVQEQDLVDRPLGHSLLLHTDMKSD
jgi:hypothetical protein